MMSWWDLFGTAIGAFTTIGVIATVYHGLRVITWAITKPVVRP